MTNRDWYIQNGDEYADYIESCNPALFEDYNKKITISPAVLKKFLAKAYNKGVARGSMIKPKEVMPMDGHEGLFSSIFGGLDK